MDIIAYIYIRIHIRLVRHRDGEDPGLYNVFVPLVDCGANNGTDLWLGSHHEGGGGGGGGGGDTTKSFYHNGVSSSSSSGRGTAARVRIERVVPSLKCGDVLLFDYRVVHRGRRNTSSVVRPIFYMTWVDARASLDNFNFPQKAIKDLSFLKEKAKARGETFQGFNFKRFPAAARLSSSSILLRKQ